jgi:hypothetical protein
MPLSREDISRLSAAIGHRNFYHVIDGMPTLKNRNGRCVFLDDAGRCTVYSIRPEGCRLYPVIFDVDDERPVLDELCPHRNDFSITDAQARALTRLINTLVEEKEE